MLNIWKIILEPQYEQVIMIPREARVLSVAEQRDQIVLYVLLNPSSENQPRRVWVIGTGRSVDHRMPSMPFVGTVKLCGGALMFHVFVENGG